MSDARSDAGPLAPGESPDAGLAAASPPEQESVAVREDRIPAAAREAGLRRHTARGTLINSAFQVGFAGLNLARRLIVAGFLTVSEYGIWGIMLTTLFLVVTVKQVGVSDKFVQQSEDDQEQAFQKAFTIDLMLSLAAMALAAIALPIFGAAYGHSEIVIPGIVLSLVLVAGSLQTPIWIFYRRMEFVQQRALQSIDPVVAITVTVALAALGFGYWAMVIGALAGGFTAAAVVTRVSPYRLGLRFDRGTVGEYFSFSWPLFLASIGSLATVQALLLIATRTIGLAGAGAITLAGSITSFTRGVDSIVTSTLYPAVCAVRDRAELLFEAFVKSNRLALMWGMPFGIGLALFAPDLVHYIYGDRWHHAVIVLQAFGVCAAFDQLGFNWTAFFRARGQTKPIAAVTWVNVASFAIVTVPLLLAFGLRGVALGWIVNQAVSLTARTYYLTKLFSGFRLLRHTVRALTPAVPPVVAVLVMRVFESGHRSLGEVVAELALYGGLTVGATILFERDLLRELLGYLRRARTAPTLAPSV